MNILGFEIVLPRPIASKAVISAFKTPVVVLLSKPIPLVAPVTGKLVIESVAAPNAAAVEVSRSPLPELVPETPPTTFPILL